VVVVVVEEERGGSVPVWLVGWGEGWREERIRD
jgi:hypothetical protein